MVPNCYDLISSVLGVISYVIPDALAAVADAALDYFAADTTVHENRLLPTRAIGLYGHNFNFATNS